ncbi:MAG: hypothetical protein ACFCUL_09925, partial [Flavobacteriaceae bacterium]
MAQTQCIGDLSLGSSCGGGGGGTTVPVNLPLSGTIATAQVASSSITVTNATLAPGAHLYIGAGNGIDGDQELIVLNTYDALGQLEKKKVGGAATANVYLAPGLQQVDFKYNIRGWLKTINEDAFADNDLFNFTIKYNDIADVTKKLYNGNISQTQWNTLSQVTGANPISNTYTYTYDALNRITGAVDNTNNYTVGNITYDKNGNILTLNRNGHQGGSTFTGMDALNYAYDSGNKLMKVADLGNDAHGFIDDAVNIADVADDYAYDQNGNMVSDANKGITAIAYNHLNLPKQITVSGTNNGTISYIYDATGAKLRKNVLTNGASAPTATDYAGNYLYENNQLQFFSTPEGYVTPNTLGGYDYIYQYKDHLGNVRLSYMQDPGN